MATLTIKTNTGFNTNDAFAFSNPQTTWKKPLLWIVKDSVSGVTHRWIGKNFTYDADGNITGGNASSLSVIDAAGSVYASVKFAAPWDFATQGSPSNYGDLLTGDDVVIGGAGNDVLGGGGKSASIPNLINTGVGLADGEIDYNYSFTNLTGTATGFSGYGIAAVGYGYPIQSGTWVTDDSTSHWLIPTENRLGSYADNYVNGDYKYSLQFDLTGYNPDTASFFGRFSADNYAVVKLNGTVIGTATDYTRFYDFSANTGFVSGINTLDFIATNYGGYGIGDNPTGLRVEFTESQVSLATNDTLKGGQGNDTYTVDSTGDKVIETASAGTDTVNSSITYKLTANVENLTLTGSETLKGLGNGLDNVITGNRAANVLLGYDGDDSLNGGLGNDNLQGGNGSDTAVYSGVSTDYKFAYKNNILKITDINLADGDDGVDTLANVEKLQFSDKTMSSNPDAESIFDTVGYYRFFAMLSSAVYLHTGVGDEATPTEHRAFELDNYQRIVSTSGFHFLSAEELGIESSGDADAIWYDNMIPADPFSLLVPNLRSYHYDFKDGFYGTDASLSPASAFASVGATNDALFVTFRGTDQTWDWVTDATGMHQQYGMYGALTKAINDYLTLKPETKVFVSGHSLGGQMATLYMSEHVSDDRFVATEFEAANKLWTDNQGNALPAHNPNIVNVEMPWDPVADLGYNRGDVIQIEFKDSNGVDYTHGIAADHPMSEVFKYIGEIDKEARNPTSDVTRNYYNQAYDLDHGSPLNLMIEAQKAMYVPGSDLIGNDTVIIDGSDGQTYRAFDHLTQNNPIIKNIIIQDDTVTGSENVNYSADPTDTHEKIIIGNAGNNKIVGGGGNDVLIGGADKDFLDGGKGSDILIGGKYDATDLSFNKERLPVEVPTLIDTYADAFAQDNQDVSYLKGGLGKDEMYGSRLDNDYFLVDVNLKNNANNVDSIKDFYMANALSDPSAEDYLVFSGEQLGIDIFKIDSNPLDYPDVLGSNNATYLSSLNFQVEDAITTGMGYGLDANEATFILSKADKGLYFDKDGENAAYTPTLLTYIEPASYGWSSDLSTFDADQILLVGSFNNLIFA